ncbi:hypothetical protein HanRHA438_Chr02g0048991 [Helianthus annuus]|nr:hypothetical protein HanRHA438_Chr02g0048991 [Helianthus annuus]
MYIFNAYNLQTILLKNLRVFLKNIFLKHIWQNIFFSKMIFQMDKKKCYRVDPAWPV